MWNLGNRDIIVLVSVISGCAILCNVWGPFYAITITLLLVICAWCTLVVADHDTPITPRTLLALDYLEEAGRELNFFLENIYLHLYSYLADVVSTVKNLYRIHVVERMAQRRRSTYQLSAETYPRSVNSRFSLVAGLSPISVGMFRSNSNSTNIENNPYVEVDSRILEHSNSVSKVTSTPIVSWKKGEARNGDIFGSEYLGANKSPWAKSGASPQNHMLFRGEDITYSTEGSPWGTSISPKMRARAGGVKTVQTVAGPLLASTRYNIDPKVYSDVTSPGLTSRLTKYATEANTKLTHQPQYGTGQFPRVNLNSSPTPLINTKTGKMRMPVTVRVAPPENTRYSPRERRNMLSDICHAELKIEPSVVQVLKEISLKRHASREDVTFELAKKQRTEGVFSDGLENLEEMTQKRTRDDSSRSEEEISPQNKSLRPAKRTKMPSCHDILSSLSSSIGVSSGVKRKAIDISRSGTPDIGKHFKSLNSSHGDGVAPVALSRNIVEQPKPNKRPLNDLDISRSSDVCSPQKKVLESVSQKGILKSPPSKQIVNNASGDAREKWSREADEREAKFVRENTVAQPQVAVKLTDRLFMKAEPQNIDKLKTLIEEHGNIKPRFVTNESDEIKKSDFVNLRQMNMKTRLKSMFDAISGKAPSVINPKVVIQAEEAKASTSSTITASLSSSTLTTNVNTSPIATSAIVPIIGNVKTSTTPAKHVTFQFTTVGSTVKTDSTESAKIPIVETKLINNVPEPKELNKVESTAIAEKPSATSSIFQTLSSPSTTSYALVSVPAFSFGSSSLKTSSPVTTNVTPTPVAISATSVSVPSSAAAAAVTTSPLQFNSTQFFNASTITTSVFGNSSPTVAKTSSSALPNFNNTTPAPEKNSQPPAVNFSFGNPATSATPPASTQSTLFASTLSQGFATPINTATATAVSSIFGIANKTTATSSPFISATVNSFAGAATPATTSIFSFGGNASVQTTEKKGFTFGAAAVSTSQSASSISSTTMSQSASTPIVAATTASTGFSFSAGNAAPTKNSLFGSMATTSSTPSSGFPPSTNTTAAFSFGSNATATSKPSFSFGSNTTSAPAATPATAPASITFGSTTSTAIPLFGVPSVTATATITAAPSSLFGTPTTSTVGFPNAATTSTFGTTNSQPSFVGTSNIVNTFGTPKTMETPTFGTSAVAPPNFATASTASSIFGGGVNSSANPISTSVAPGFGTSNFGETKPPPAFGANATSSFAGSSGTSLFGSQPTNNSSFGASNPATTDSTPLFGTPNTPAQTFGTPSTAPPAFGTTNSATTTFGTPRTSAPAFGANNISTPAFGLQSSVTGTSGNQNSTSSAFSATSPAFGAVTTAPPVFGTSISSPSGFGTLATSGFSTPSNPPPAFSSTNSNFSGFGGGSNAASPFRSHTTPGTSTFGAQSSAAPTFGSSSANNSSFTFGTAQPPVQQPQPSSVFAFGGNNAPLSNNAASGSAPFQFGHAASQAAGGFNFSGAPSAPALNFSRDGPSGGAFTTSALGANAFNAPTSGGMFSIGSGSTGPRSRPSRRRQR